MTFTIPGYHLQRRLGQGSQGEVWLAEHSGTGDRVALKCFRSNSPDAAEVARAEAGLLAGLDHPSLIALREFRSCEDGFVLVLELAEAGSLATLLQRRGKLTPAEVVATVSPVAAALAHAHDARVLHGDVSPANILFNAGGRPKLADLGVARLVAGIGAGSGLGTPAYLDPIVAAGGAPGLPSDVFSLAAVTLQALTGAGPWLCPGVDQPSAEQVLAVAATGRIADLSGRLAAAPPAMATALIRALDRDPIRRGTAAEFALDVRAAVPPSPVVLAGGRITGTVGRHSAEHRSLDDVGQPTGSFLAADGSGPQFVPADLTRVSRPLVRAQSVPTPAPQPVGKLRAIAHQLVGGSAARAVAVLALVVMLVAAGVLGWPLLRRRAGSVPSTSAPATSRTAAPGAAVSPSTPVGALAVLSRLDALRAQAYAQRRPELLEQVYASPALLAADTATLNRLVPVKCSLAGLHTSYRSPAVTAVAGRGVTVRITASLPAGSLRCPGASTRATAAIGPQALVIDLTDGGGGYRISSQRVG